MADKLIIFDTTLRDGEQVPGCQLNTEEKLQVAEQLELLGVDIIEAGFPISSPGDFYSVTEISKIVRNATVCGLTRANKKDIETAAEALKFAKKPRIHTGIGTSDNHIKFKFNSTREAVLERAVEAVKYAKTFVEDIEFYAEDAGRTDNEFLARVIEAVVKAIKDFPKINASVDGDKIIYRKNINIGMAAALPSGNLIVPVIKNADQLNLVGMAKAVNDLGNRAKAGKLKPDDTQGGTYTVTNVGTFGSVFGTPIINQPQVGILALGAIRKVPAVIETPEGDFIGIRQKMFLSHSYDHRVVDGALGGSFVKRVAEYLEAFDVNRDF